MAALMTCKAVGLAFAPEVLHEMAERLGCYLHELHKLTYHELHDLALMLDEREVRHADAVP